MIKRIKRNVINEICELYNDLGSLTPGGTILQLLVTVHQQDIILRDFMLNVI